MTFGHAFNAQDRVVGAGYDNGDVKLFDLRAMALRWETNLKNGVCSLQFDRKDIEMNKVRVIPFFYMCTRLTFAKKIEDKLKTIPPIRFWR